MEKISRWIVEHKKTTFVSFILLLIISLICKPFISVNYDVNDYLPEDSPSTVSLDVMMEEFDDEIPNARVMISDVSIPEALEYKAKLSNLNGVKTVLWLDDSINLNAPLETQDTKAIETYYKDNCAIFSVTIGEEEMIPTVKQIREIIGNDNAMTGNAISTAIATENTVSEVTMLSALVVLVVFIVLCFTTTAWIEPILIIIGLGVSILINDGTNIIFGEISFVTNAAGSALQIAVSLDFSIFLLHRFEEYRKSDEDDKSAMVKALCKTASSIFSSGLTTMIGFLALTLMQFKIGSDLGQALAKGIVISMLTVIIFMPPLILTFSKYIDRTSHRNFMPNFSGLGKIISRISIPAFCLFLLIIIPSYVASTVNDYYYGASHIYDERTQYGQDTEKINEIFGKVDTNILMVPKGDFSKEKQLSDALHKIPEVKNIISYVDTVGAQVPVEYLDKSQQKMLMSEHYSRMVISVDSDTDSNDAFSLVSKIRETAQEYYPDSYYLAGASISIYDLMDTITHDMQFVNLIAIAAIFIVLLFTMKSISLPAILVLCIEGAVWVNMARPYFSGNIVFYISYLIISTVQLGATVDYAILFTTRFMENRKSMDKKTAVSATIQNVAISIITSATIMAMTGFLMSKISTHGILEQLGEFLGVGTVLSFLFVMFVLPGFLIVFDWIIEKTTYKPNFKK